MPRETFTTFGEEHDTFALEQVHFGTQFDQPTPIERLAPPDGLPNPKGFGVYDLLSGAINSMRDIRDSFRGKPDEVIHSLQDKIDQRKLENTKFIRDIVHHISQSSDYEHSLLVGRDNTNYIMTLLRGEEGRNDFYILIEESLEESKSADQDAPNEVLIFRTTFSGVEIRNLELIRANGSMTKQPFRSRVSNTGLPQLIAGERDSVVDVDQDEMMKWISDLSRAETLKLSETEGERGSYEQNRGVQVSAVLRKFGLRIID